MHTDPDSRWFDRFIVLIIFINCLFLAAVDPLDTNPNSPLNTVRATTRVQPHVRLPLTPARHVTSRWGARDTMQVLDTADLVFQIIYTIEMFFKCAAFGVFCGPRAYVKQTWNIIDGSLVLAGWFGYLPFFQGASLSSIRIVRMLRPLRTVQVVPGLKVRPACSVLTWLPDRASPTDTAVADARDTAVADALLACVCSSSVACQLHAGVAAPTGQRAVPVLVPVSVVRYYRCVGKSMPGVEPSQD